MKASTFGSRTTTRSLAIVCVAIVLQSCNTDFGVLFSVPQMKQLADHWEAAARDLLKP
jgi:hypothetical protein